MTLRQPAERALEEFYADVAALDLQPLWTQTKNLMPNEPRPATRPWLWKWRKVRQLCERAGDLVPIERGGERRVLSLSNPGLGGLPFATSALWGAFQYLGPEESAPAHRRSTVYASNGKPAIRSSSRRGLRSITKRASRPISSPSTTDRSSSGSDSTARLGSRSRNRFAGGSSHDEAADRGAALLREDMRYEASSPSSVSVAARPR